MVNYEYVKDAAALRLMCEELASSKDIAIDIECENNLHHYGAYITLIQLSSGSKHYLVDVLVLEKIDCLITLFEDASIQKIFHDVSFDLRMLDYQYGCSPKNIFDTQLAALFCGEESVGLGSLLEKYFSVKKIKKFQMADWTKRPLSSDMLSYAIKDTIYLVQLRNILKKKLVELRRMEWVSEEGSLLEKREWKYSEGNWTSVKGYRELSDIERGRLYELFILRDRLAKDVDRPVHFVISTRKLVGLCTRPPASLYEWQKMKGVHPIVKKSSEKFFDAVQRAKPVLVERVVRKRYTPEQKKEAEKLNAIQLKLASKFSIPGYLFMNKDQIKEIVLSGSLKGLHKWQRELVEG